MNSQKITLPTSTMFLHFTSKLHHFNIPQCCRPSHPAHCLVPVAMETFPKMLLLTILAESSHESWRTVTRSAVFITYAAILAHRADFSTAQTPETLWTHCKDHNEHFYDFYHVNFKSIVQFSYIYKKNLSTHSFHSGFLMCLLDTDTLPLLCHMVRRCSYKSERSRAQIFPLDRLTEDTQEGFVSTQDHEKQTNKPKACKNQAVHLDRSSPHEDQEGTFVGTLRSRGDTTLLMDRHTSSHSRFHKYLACILETM